MTMTGTDIVMDDFFWRACLGAGLLGAAAGPIGCFVLWRRMAYLGASIAHMALLGVALGLIAGVAPFVGVLAVSLAAALLLTRAGDNAGPVPADTLIGLIGHAGLALGFILLATMETIRADLLGYLFGDVLALSRQDNLAIAAASAVSIGLLVLVWRDLLADTLAPDIVIAEDGAGRSRRVRMVFLLLVAFFIALGLKVVGALLIVALLVIPPAAARPFARTPEAMAILAALVGAISAPLGLIGSFYADLPAGPAIVLAATVLFLASAAAARFTK